jgi:uncharacterized membrane protein YjjB (DUF3815 family)
LTTLKRSICDVPFRWARVCIVRIVVAFGASVPVGWAVGTILLAPPNPWPPLIAATVITLVGLLWSEMWSAVRKMFATPAARNEHPQLDRTP